MKISRMILAAIGVSIMIAGNIMAQTAPPVLDTIFPGDVSPIYEGENVNFEVRATDADGTIPLLSVYGLPDGADFIVNGDGTGTFDWTPDYNQHAVYPVTFFAVDAVTPDSDTMIVPITVLDVDVPPVLDPINDTIITVGNRLVDTVLATDADGTIPILSAQYLPPGAEFTDYADGSGLFDWTPDSTQQGIYWVTYVAHDAITPDSDWIQVQITVTNLPPVLDSIGNKTCPENDSLGFYVTASDPDGTIPSLTTSILPANASFTDFSDGSGEFSFTPDYTQAGIYIVTFYADDGDLQDSEMVEITVPNVNAPPILDSIGDKTVAEGAYLNFQVVATEPYDLTIPILTVSPLPTNASFVDNLDGTGVFDFDPDYTQWGWYAITFYATDDSAAVDSEMIYIEVTNAGGTLFVTTLADTGEGSLRHAIDLSNAHIDEDTIEFTVSGTILLSSSLVLTDDRGTQILGATAPGGARSVVLDGQLGVPIGFDVRSLANFIRDLVLVNFDDYAIVMTPVLGPNYITGCYLNVDASGTVRGTSGGGVAIIGSLNAGDIGGSTESDRNVIAGGGGNPAIYIYQSDRVGILGNYIGLAASGTEPLANPVLTEVGVYIVESTNIMIGDIFPGYRNIISGNATGIRAQDSYVNVAGNYIGLDRQGNPLGNGSSGITFEVGSVSSVFSNTIAFNGGNGIEVLGGQNDFAANKIYENGLLAIDLGGDGVTINDPGDGDTGPNGLHNFPEIDSIISLPDKTYLIYGTAGANDRVEFFVAHPPDDSTRPPDPSGYGEAYTDLGGPASSPAGDFSYQTDLSVAPFSLLSCTATDPMGNTSEMSENFILMPKPLIVVARGYLPPLDRDTVSYQNFVNIMVYDPIGNQFGKDSLGNLIEEIVGAEYWETDKDSVVIPDPIIGDYTFHFLGEAGAPEEAVYSAIIKTDGLQESIIVAQNSVPPSGESDSAGFTYDEGGNYVNGDANTDGSVNIGDAVHIVDYIFKMGPPPDPFLAGDADCDLDITIEDAVYLLDYIFRSGGAPCYFEL